MATNITVNTDSPEWISNNDTIRFEATINGRRIPCTISFEAMLDRYHPSSTSVTDVMAAFEKNQEDIQQLARTLIESRNCELDRLVIESTDF